MAAWAVRSVGRKIGLAKALVNLFILLVDTLKERSFVVRLLQACLLSRKKSISKWIGTSEDDREKAAAGWATTLNLNLSYSLVYLGRHCNRAFWEKMGALLLVLHKIKHDQKVPTFSSFAAAKMHKIVYGHFKAFWFMNSTVNANQWQKRLSLFKINEPTTRIQSFVKFT